MITLTILLIVGATIGICAAIVLAIAAGCFAGIGLIVADICLGLSPFIAIGLIVRWLSGKKESEEKKPEK